MPLISIVVPVYNVEKYLETCVESLLSQSLKDIEIILVDDGSTDISGEICDIYSQRYSSIKVIHKENGGSRSAVITGIMAATANIIGFCDSDDYVSADYYETLYTVYCENNPDMVSCILKIVYDENDRDYNQDISFTQIYASDILQMFWDSGNLVTGNNRCTKLFKKELLNRILVDIDVDTNIGEDTIQMLCYLSKCRGYVCFLHNFNGYFYRQLDTSIMNKFNEKMITHNVNYIKALKNTAQRLNRDYKNEIQVTNSILANLMYKCIESNLSIKEKVKYVKIILSYMTDKHRFADKYLPNLNPVMKTGFRMIGNKWIVAGVLFGTAYIKLVNLLVSHR